jgi:hypothetical protein
MKYPFVCIGTYHKTGTVWMQKVFKLAARDLGLRYEGSNLVNVESFVEPGIFLDGHCRFPDELLAKNMPAFRMIRDPRDVVISGAHYHVKSTESWLDLKQDYFGGESYRTRITECATWRERYSFEMRNVAGGTTRAMVAETTSLPAGFRTVRYEDLMQEGAFEAFADLLVYLGFDGREQKALMASFEKRSFVGSLDVTAQKHGRSGKVAQWKQNYSRDMGEEFIEQFGTALIDLGYESDDSWLELLPAEKEFPAV